MYGVKPIFEILVNGAEKSAGGGQQQQPGESFIQYVWWLFCLPLSRVAFFGPAKQGDGHPSRRFRVVRLNALSQAEQNHSPSKLIESSSSTHFLYK